VPNYEEVLAEVCATVDNHAYWLSEGLRAFPSIYFGLEMALLDLETNGSRTLFSSDFSEKETPLRINGLIWMGDKSFMFDQIQHKIQEGWDCIKLKIGAINFEEELDLLRYIRKQFSKNEVEIRVDANGAFSPATALEKLKRLSDFDLHSIEQPIKPRQIEAMAALCEQTPLPIALDEELIGIFEKKEKKQLLETICPQFLIFKPSFIGGFHGTQEWLTICETLGIDWWVTSALESNIGLNAIAQWTATLNNPLPQGLGTGQLYTNNISSPLEVNRGFLKYNKKEKWDLSRLKIQ
jgi:o-succinylbenzoate synthase